MKKYIIFIVIIGVILGGFLVKNTIETEQNRYKDFYNSGYILKSFIDTAEQNDLEKCYFKKDEKYKSNYAGEIEFKDKDGQNVVTSSDSFVHYDDGSISALKKGVILNINDINNEPILYYNINANKVLTSRNDAYIVEDLLDSELEFTNFIWKISDNKFLIVGDTLKLKTTGEDEKEQDINKYIELEYGDNEIVKLYNQEVIYQTISSSAILQITEGVELKLDTRYIRQNSENIVSLGNMVIDSDDNIQIADITDEEKQDENQEIAENAENVTGGTNGQDGIDGQDGRDGANGEAVSAGTQGQTEELQGIIDELKDVVDIADEANREMTNSIGNATNAIEYIEDADSAPVFRVTELDVNAIGIQTRIEIDDDDARLKDDVKVQILENDTGKTVYSEVATLEDVMSNPTIDVFTETLTPSTEYILTIESTYEAKDSIRYTKNFVYKVFETEEPGINFEKDYYTVDSLSFKVNIEPDSKVESASLVLRDKNGNVIGTEGISKSTKTVLFSNINTMGLTSNTEYVVSLEQVNYEGRVLANGFKQQMDVKTLKQKYKVNLEDGHFLVTGINKRESKFEVTSNIEDVDNGITNITYELYEMANLDGNPVEKISAGLNEKVSFNVDGERIKRNTIYIIKAVITFNDNEKEIIETISGGESVSLDSKEFPTIRFESEEGYPTYERIKGNIYIDDQYNTIDTTKSIEVTYINNTSLKAETITYNGIQDNVIPIDINGLHANTTYNFQVKGTVDLQEEYTDPTNPDAIINGPIENCYIGGFGVTTTKPYDLVLNAENNEEDISNAFNVKVQLKNQEGVTRTLEAETLTQFKISIYRGTMNSIGEKIKTTTIKDRKDDEPYESTIKEEWYDLSNSITPATFGLTNSDFKTGNYVIIIDQGKDYTEPENDYENANDINILNGVFEFRSNKTIPDLPSNTKNAMNVDTIYNGDSLAQSKGYYNPDLADRTVVGYNVQAGFDNTDEIAVRVHYYLWKEGINTPIAEATAEVTGKEMPKISFQVLEGTYNDIVDNIETDSTKETMKRGNRYYFSYTVECKISQNSSAEVDYIYPGEDENGNEVTDETQRRKILTSSRKSPEKQEANIIMYPSTSSSNTITIKYKFSDIDHAVERETVSGVTGKFMYASTDSVQKDVKEIQETGETFTPLTMERLETGEVRFAIKQRTMKSNGTETTKLMTQKFEGTRQLEEIKYTTRIYDNKLIMDLEGDYSRVAGYYIEISSSGMQTKVIPVVEQTENRIVVNLTELTEFLEREITVDVYAYYEDGGLGFDLDSSSGYYTFIDRDSNDVDNYVWVNSKGEVTNKQDISGAIYNNVSMQQQESAALLDFATGIGNNVKSLTLGYSEKGFTHGYSVITRRTLAKQQIEVTDNGTKTVLLDKIIPGIDLIDENGKPRITTTLKTAQLDAKITYMKDIIEFPNGIEVDLYETNSSGIIIDPNTPKKTYRFTIDENGKLINNPVEGSSENVLATLDDLEPKKDYAIKIKADLKKVSTGEVERSVYLYDEYYQQGEQTYPFSTKVQVQISDLVVNYVANSYNSETDNLEGEEKGKTIDITYGASGYTGVDKTSYKIEMYDYENETWNELITSEEIGDDNFLSSNMVKKIDANPGSKFKFGKDENGNDYLYRVILIPTAIYVDGTGTEQLINVGEGKYTDINGYVSVIDENSELEGTIVKEFKLDALKEPAIAVSGEYGIPDETDITFRATVNDEHRIVVNGTYTVRITKQEKDSDEIVPIGEEKTFSIFEKNNEIVVDDIDLNATYTIELTAIIDQDNTTENLRSITKTAQLKITNEYGIQIGEITTTRDIEASNKVRLMFTNTYKLCGEPGIQYIVYTIQDKTGYVQTNRFAFEPTQLQLGEETIYTLTLPEELESTGAFGITTYTIQMAFYKTQDDYINGRAPVEERTIPYIYIQN